MATRMTRGQRRTLRLLTLVALATLFYGALQLVGRQPARVQSLPDGSNIRIQAVQYGPGRAQINLVRPLRFLEGVASDFSIGEKWAARLGLMRGGLGNPAKTNDLAVYTFREKLPPSMEQNLAMTVLDQHGVAFEARVIGGCGPSATEMQEVWLLPVFPRREKVLPLRVAWRGTSDAPKTAAEFDIRNPLNGPFPVWTTDLLPATKTNGDLAVTLVELQSGLHLPVNLHDNLFGDVTASKVTLQVSEAGRTATVWRVRSIELADATGNRWQPQNWRTNDCVVVDERDVAVVTIRGALPFDEPVWKVRVELSPTTAFETNECFTLGPVMVPRAGDTLEMKHLTNFHGATISIPTFRGRDAVTEIFPLKIMPVSSNATVIVYCDFAREDQRLTLVEVTDEQNRPVPHHVVWPAKAMQCFDLEVPSGAEELLFKFALHPSRWVEFQVKPAWVDVSPGQSKEANAR